MLDTYARKATRWGTKKGITTGIKHVGDSMMPGVGTLVSNGVKLLVGNELEKAGQYMESVMFENGDFQFYCPHCHSTWRRQIPHSVGNLTLTINHDYVKRFYNKELTGRLALILLAVVISILNLGLLYLCFNWASSLPSTILEHTNGFFGLGAKDYETVNYTYYFAWFLFILGIASNFKSIRYIFDKYKDWKQFKLMDYELFRFRLLTNQRFDEMNDQTSGIDTARLVIGIVNLGLSIACGSYCYFNEYCTFVSVEPTIWNLGQDKLMKVDYLWYLMAFMTLVFGIIAFIKFINMTKKDNKTH